MMRVGPSIILERYMVLQVHHKYGRGIEMPTLEFKQKARGNIRCLLLNGCVFLTFLVIIGPPSFGSFEQAIAKLHGAESPVKELLLEGDTYRREGRYQLAVETYTQALKYGSYVFDLYIGRSRTYLELRRYPEALADASSAIKERPQDSQGYLAKALAYWELNRSQESIAEFTKAIEVASSHKKLLLYSLRAGAYLDFGKPEEALEDLSLAINLGYDNAIAFHRRAMAHSRLGRYEEASRDLSVALQRDPSHVERLVHRGAVYGCLEEYTLAKADLDKAVVLQPDNLEARLERGSLSIETDSFRTALEDLKYARDNGKKDPYLFLSLGYAYYRLGDVNMAIQANGEAFALSEEKTLPVATLHKGLFLLVQGRGEEAKKVFREASMLAEQQRDYASIEYALEELDRFSRETSTFPEFVSQIQGELHRTYERLAPPANHSKARCRPKM